MMNETYHPREEAQILRAMLSAPDQQHSGRALIQATGLDCDIVYPVLVDLERAGLVIMEHEPDRRAEGISRFIAFRLKPDFLEQARTRVAALNAETT